MAELHLPATIPPLFRDLPRHVEVDATTVQEAIERLDERWPGLRDRLCEPGPVLRRHINVYVDRERAGLDTALEERSRVDVIAAISGG
jgi:molybdopterin converting factor small subunit